MICKIALIATLSSWYACDWFLPGYKYEEGSLPDRPVNLVDFNTVYDDYNSTAPTLGDLIPFCFSTNRKSQGKDFDIIFEPMNVRFDKKTGKLEVLNDYANWSSRQQDYEIIETGLKKISTIGNELGPNLLAILDLYEYKVTLLYSTDITGDAQINFISNQTTADFSQPREIRYLNSTEDDMYPTFNPDQSKIYFCSNRNGQDFNFYYVNLGITPDLEKSLSDTVQYEVHMDSILSSGGDDKCPFILDNILVFASDRDGGFGGFDLYYSILEKGVGNACQFW